MHLPVILRKDYAMKSPRAAAHPCPLSRQAAQMIIGDSIWQIKKSGFSLRTKK
jgi:hypothetical protein